MMDFSILQLTSLFVGTVVFLLHTTRVNDKVNKLNGDCHQLQLELEDAQSRVLELANELENMKSKMQQISALTS
jgi:uncharacterized protein YeeX (DUF496 family)